MAFQHSNWNRPINTRSMELPADCDEQTDVTISLMRNLASEDARSVLIRAMAGRLPAHAAAAVDAIFWTVRKSVAFKRDSELAQGVEGWSPDIVEVLIRPVDLIAMRPAEGDCDDFSMLVASLCMAAGIPASFVAIAADPLEPARYSHVYVVAHLFSGDRAIDASHGRSPGWECQNLFGKRTLWRVDSMSAGLAGPFDYLNVPEFLRTPDFSVTKTETAAGDSSWWQDLIKLGATTGASVVQTRFGLPENSYVVNKDGSLASRGSSTTPAGIPVTDVRGSAVLGGDSTWLLILAALAIFVLILATRGGGRK